jgi:hypothetical protein
MDVQLPGHEQPAAATVAPTIRIIKQVTFISDTLSSACNRRTAGRPRSLGHICRAMEKSHQRTTKMSRLLETCESKYGARSG